MRLSFRLMLILVFIVTTWSYAQKNEDLSAAANEKYKVFKETPSAENFQISIAAWQELARSLPEESGRALSMQSYIYYLYSVELLKLAESHLQSMKAKDKFLLANLYLNIQEYDQAISIYQQLNETNPKWSCPFRHKGEAYYEKGDYTQAGEALKKAIETNENHTDAYLWQAKNLYQLGEFEQGLISIDRAIALLGKNKEDNEEEIPEEYYEMKADLLVKLERKPEALVIYQKILNSSSEQSRIQNKIDRL